MDAFELSAAIKLNANEFNSGLKNAESKFQAFGKKLASAAGKAVAVASAALATGTVMIGKQAVAAYAEYEQLVGGVETLFKDSAKTVQKYATQAYKTAGVSANKYMEISTSFAASLVSSLKGDTAQAAELANMAIVDMSDNANKMGTDLTAIQNAYQGFAKQNYTMLDNLKLGYGGTKTEMERLLKTANEINKQHGIMSDYTIENFSDIVSAIHTVQSEMGIAGTTMKEAGSTISGSINMVKAAWQDMLVAITNPEGQTQTLGGRGQFIQDEFASIQKTSETSVKSATARLVESVKTMFENVMPAVHQFVSGFGEFLAEIAPTIGEELPKLVAEFLPKFIEAGKNLITGLGSGIAQAAKDIQWPEWKDVQATAQDAWNKIIDGAKHLVGKIVYGTDEKGEVKWPEWDGDTTDLEKIWTVVKDAATGVADTFGALVFGRDKDTGKVNWPDISKIDLSGAEELWKKIKEHALSFAGLVFGKDDATGKVNWPKWSTIKNTMEAYWSFICGEAAKLKGLVFGDAADAGSIFESILTSWNKLHDTIVNGAINISTYFFDEADPTAVSVAIKGISDAIVPLAAAIATAGFISNFTTMINNLRTLFTMNTGATNWVAVALAGVAALATYFAQNWDDWGPRFTAIGEWINTNIITPIGNAIETVKQLIDWIKQLLGVGGSGSGASLNDAQITKVMQAYDAFKNAPKGISGIAERNKKYEEFTTAVREAMTEAQFATGEIDATIEKLNNGLVEGNIESIIESLKGTGTAANDATTTVEGLQEALENVAKDYNANININVNGDLPTLHGFTSLGEAPTRPRVKKAKGDWSVPYDNFPALLHRNEMVLTASQANKLRNGGMNNFDSAAIAEAVRGAVMDLTMELNNETVGRVFGNATTRRVRNNISQINRRHQYGYGG